MVYNRDFDQGSAGTSLIDRESSFSGTFRSPRDLHVEGECEGEIECEGTVSIAESARVTGTIHAGNVVVSGQLQGHVTCSGRFEILSSGQVGAHVVAGTVIVYEGAFYEGEMRMHAEPEGLPARELPGASSDTLRDTGITRITRRKPEDTTVEEQPETSDHAAVANARDADKSPALRAVSDA
jgi:cytoskeletal protein CcmA (bactofilin family)